MYPGTRGVVVSRKGIPGVKNNKTTAETLSCSCDSPRDTISFSDWRIVFNDLS